MEYKNINKISNKNNSLKQIHNLYFSGKYRETIALCDSVLGNSKQIIEILDVKAGAFMALNDFDSAYEIYIKILQNDNTHKLSFYNIGLIKQITGEYELAIKSYLKCLKLDPKHYKSLSNLGVIYSETNDFNSAINAYKLATKIEPNLNSYLNMSIAFFAKGNLLESYKTCLKALECNLYTMEVWVHIFYVLSAGRFNIKNLRKIIEKLEILVLRIIFHMRIILKLKNIQKI